MKKPIFVILEGSDNTGKDTQQKLLQTHFKDDIFHCFHYSGLNFDTKEEHIVYSTRMYDDMFKLMCECLVFSGLGRNFIFNRSHLGEAVYSPLYRDYDGDYVFDIEREYVDRLNDNLYLIVLTDDPETVIKRDDGMSFYKDIQGVTKEIEYFKRAFIKSLIKNKTLININNKSPREVNSEIIDFIQNT